MVSVSSKRRNAILAPSWSPLGVLLGPFWGPLGAHLGSLGALLGLFGEAWEASWVGHLPPIFIHFIDFFKFRGPGGPSGLEV